MVAMNEDLMTYRSPNKVQLTLDVVRLINWPLTLMVEKTLHVPCS